MITNLRGAPDAPPEQPPEYAECGRCMNGDTKDGETCTDCGGVAPIEVGVWDVDEDTYFADTKHVSNSMLKTFSESIPRYYAKYVTKTLPNETSDALRLGSAFDSMLLHPGLNRVVQAPICDRRTKDGKVQWELFLRDNAGRIVVSAEEYRMLCGMVIGIRENYTTDRLISEHGMRGIIFRWWHPGTRLWCKAMMDSVASDVIVDLKTIDRLENWPKAVANWKYYRQQAWYQSGDRAIIEHFGQQDKPKEFVFVVVEKEPPYEAAAFTLDEDAVAQGHSENEAAIEELARCLRSDRWESRYRGDIFKTSLPRWAMKGA